MLDSLFRPGTRERAIAEIILAAASKGRRADPGGVALLTSAPRDQVLAVMRRLADAGLMPPIKSDGGDAR